MSDLLISLYMREVRLARRIGGGGTMGLVFFLILVSITPFAIGPDLNLLARIGPAILWIAALLATLLGLDRLFQADQEDGSLDLLRMTDAPLELIVLTKCLAHWTVTGLPLILAAPIFGLMLALEPAALWGVTLTLLVGTPALTCLGAMGAALTASIRRGGLLMAILVLPLCVPVLIFGVSAAGAAQDAVASFTSPFLLLCALTLVSLASAPFAAAAALRALSD